MEEVWEVSFPMGVLFGTGEDLAGFMKHWSITISYRIFRDGYGDETNTKIVTSACGCWNTQSESKADWPEYLLKACDHGWFTVRITNTMLDRHCLEYFRYATFWKPGIFCHWCDTKRLKQHIRGTDCTVLWFLYVYINTQNPLEPNLYKQF
jgi:hypothetical protein